MPGKETLEKRLGLNEFKVGELEKAVLEQGKLLARVGAKAHHLEEHANDLPEAFSNNVEALWLNQKTLEWKVDKILHMLMPEDYPNPGELELPDYVEVESDSESKEAEGTEAPEPEPAREASMPEVREGLQSEGAEGS